MITIIVEMRCLLYLAKQVTLRTMQQLRFLKQKLATIRIYIVFASKSLKLLTKLRGCFVPNIARKEVHINTKTTGSNFYYTYSVTANFTQQITVLFVF